MFDNLQGSLADVVGDTPEPTFELDLHDDWYLAIDEDWFYDEPHDPEFDYDLHADFEDEDEAPPEDLGHDPYEHLPFIGKISPAACLGYRVQRPGCRCCGGFMGVRRAWRRVPKFNDKPKRKDHRS